MIELDNGFNVNDVFIDIDELKEYCRKKGIKKNNGKSHSMFASGRQTP